MQKFKHILLNHYESLVLNAKAMIAWQIILMILCNIILVLHSHGASVKKPHENIYNDIYCQQIGGVRETRHIYSIDHNSKARHVFIDCETSHYVIEGGLDKRSSLDSLQQAMFFAVITKKLPMVVIYDTDNHEDIYEYRIRMACLKAGVAFANPYLKL